MTVRCGIVAQKSLKLTDLTFTADRIKQCFRSRLADRHIIKHKRNHKMRIILRIEPIRSVCKNCHKHTGVLTGLCNIDCISCRRRIDHETGLVTVLRNIILDPLELLVVIAVTGKDVTVEAIVLGCQLCTFCFLRPVLIVHGMDADTEMIIRRIDSVRNQTGISSRTTIGCFFRRRFHR